MCTSCRLRQELSKEYALAKVGFDIAENGPLKVCHFLPPQAPAPFSRNPGEGKQRSALRHFDRMFDSQTRTVGSAVSTGSQFDQTPASQFSPVSPPYSQFSSTPASQSSPVSPQYSPASPSQPAPVSDRRPRRRKGPSSSA